MKGTWGRRVFGRITKGPKYTRFHLEVKLDNGCTIFTAQVVSNAQLEFFKGLYGYTLDEMTAALEERIKARAQIWGDQ